MKAQDLGPPLPKRPLQMTRGRIADQLALEQGLSRAAALQIVDNMLQIISDKVAGGEEVCLPPIGRLRLARSSGSSGGRRARVKFTPAPALARRVAVAPLDP